MNHKNTNIRKFYDNLYSTKQSFNPAFDIYNDLRARKIFDSLASGAKTKILIIGCGSKKDYDFISETKNSYGFDISYNAINKLEKNSKFLVANGQSIPFKSNYFETIIISEVIEHVENFTQVYSEIERVIMNGGKLILTTPNWISLFGLFRKIAEIFVNHPVTSDDQPYDDWKTFWKLKKELPNNFHIIDTAGIWYLPPLHYRGKGFSKNLTKKIYKFFKPFDSCFSKYLPYFGHLLFIECKVLK
jgi:SAM-dependent methyltransferase